MTTEVDFIPATSENKPVHSPVDISSKKFWAQTSEERDRTFARLRQEDQVSWQRPVEDAVTPDPNDPGYWALVKHRDIVTVSRDAKTFISGQGVLFDMLPPYFLELSQSFMAMDAPRHDHLRRLVSAAFTPKQIKRIDEKIIQAAKEIIDDVEHETEPIDFVERIGQVLPVRMFCDLFGVPEEMRQLTHDSAAGVVAWADPESLGGRPPQEVQVEACTNLHAIAKELVEARRKNPTDDLFSTLVAAEVDGEKLTDFEIGSFFVLLAVAGTDTTKQTSAFTVRAMTDFPEQRQYLLDDFDGRINVAIEEFIRWASPVMTFRRTAVKETTLGGKTILPGDKVVMFYPSGNFDEEVFGDPEKFDVSRNPNPHVGFGGGGLHFCLGNQLAKGMLRALFHQILTRIPNFEAGEPDLLGTNFIRGVRHMPFLVNGGK